MILLMVIFTGIVCHKKEIVHFLRAEKLYLCAVDGIGKSAEGNYQGIMPKVKKLFGIG